MMFLRRSLISRFFLFLTITSALCAQGSGEEAAADTAQTVSSAPCALIETAYYSRDNYVRHPRLKEKDKQSGTARAFQPGLEIICNVDNAEIRFSGEKTGRTPAEWDNIPAGSYKISLERSGYTPCQFRVEVNSDLRTAVTVILQPAESVLILENLPPGARLRVNNTDYPLAEGNAVSLPAGTNRISVRAFGWETAEDTVNIRAGTENRWTYPGRPAAFNLTVSRTFPRALASDDLKGFRFSWQASAPGTAAVRIVNSSGTVVAEGSLNINSAEGALFWRPGETDISAEAASSRKISAPAGLPEGVYRFVMEGTGRDNTNAGGEALFRLDERFNRSPRPAAYALPGLMYSPGSAMLPAGIWQAGTLVSARLGTGPLEIFQSVPVSAGFRVSPAARWETGSRFGISARYPLENSSLFFSVYGAWRINSAASPFTANLALMFLYEGVSGSWQQVPDGRGDAELPGLQLTVPMEYSLGQWSLSAAPSLHLFFLGNDSSRRSTALPARLAASLSGGVYLESGRFLAGASFKARSPDFQNSFMNWTLFSGLEGRFDFPEENSYIALSLGMNALNTPLIFIPSLEFGVIR